jgi:hypothetical protein
MKIILMLLGITFPLLAFGQKGTTSTTSTTSATSGAFIDVTATTDTLVEPDIFYVVFQLKEKTENKVKVTTGQQLDKIKYALQNSGVTIENFLLEKEGADQIKVLPVKKEDPAPQSYIMMIKEADQVKRNLKTIDSLGAYDIHITEIGYSKQKDVEKQLRIDAMKGAKGKADYMLTAIGNTTGKVIYVYEDGCDVYYGDGPQFRRYPDYTGTSDGGNDANVGDLKIKTPAIDLDKNVIKKIKYEYIVVVRFEIK